MVVSYSVYFSRKKGQNSSKAKFHVSLPFVRFDISIINIVNIMWYDIGISMEVDTVRIFLEKRFFHASFVQCSMQMGMNFLFQFRIRFVRKKVVPSYFLESTRGYYVSCYVHRWTPCRCAISVRNKVTCNSLVICNAPLPLSWDQFVQYDTIVSWNFILLGPCELNFLTKRSKKRSCATSRSFIPFQGRYFRHVRKLPDEKLNLWRGKLIWRWIAAFRIVYCSFFLSFALENQGSKFQFSNGKSLVDFQNSLEN